MRAKLILFLLLSATCAPASAQTAAERDYVIELLSNLNPLSIKYNREICGFIVRFADGRIGSTDHAWGMTASCRSLPLPRDVTPIASWHTHGAWSQRYDSEVPSMLDVEGDMSFGVNGWVATPGGRLWFIDGETGSTRQVCGRDCLPSDPNFFAEDYGPVAKEYTFEQLRRRFGR